MGSKVRVTRHSALATPHRVHCSDLGEHHGGHVELVGAVSGLRVRPTATGRRMLFFVLTDTTGSVNVVWFPPRQGHDTRETLVNGGLALRVRGPTQCEHGRWTLVAIAAEFA